MLRLNGLCIWIRSMRARSRLLLFTLFVFSEIAFGQVRVEFAAPGTTYIASLPLRNGNRLLVGSANNQMVIPSTGANPFTNTAIGGVPAVAAVDPFTNTAIG